MFALFDNQSNENLLQKYILVEISEASYAFKIEYVREIIPVIEIYTVETLQNNITGLVNLRGETLPVYDLRGFLGKEISPLNIHKKLLILMANNKKFAIIIDEVGDILQISAESVSQLSYNGSVNFLSTAVINNSTVIIIDVEKFIDYALEIHNINKISAQNLIPVDSASIEKIKTRTVRLNKNDNYTLTPDTFLNEKFIIFKLSGEIYAFNISYIKEIKKIHMSAISKIPCVPDFIVGIINFRGDYISILDIKTFLNIKVTPLKNKLDIVILKINKLKVAILVDEILDITNLPIATLNSETSSSESYIIGELLYKENNLLNMLNIEKLFSSENVNIENYE